MESKGLLEHTPAGVAAFLHQHAERLDKSAIGEYLGKEKEYKGGFCMKVHTEFRVFTYMCDVVDLATDSVS